MTDEAAPIGHNSIGGDEIRSIIERVERLEAEKADIAQDIREIYIEAKYKGFDTKALRKLIRLRKMDAAQRREEEAILEMYMHAIGMI